MHVNYLVLGILFSLRKVDLGKRTIYIFTSIFLLFFMFLTGFTPSVVRACIMGILSLFAKIFYRKVDILTSISFSLCLILAYNPYSIFDIGLQLSYLGTIRHSSFF